MGGWVVRIRTLRANHGIGMELHCQRRRGRRVTFLPLLLSLLGLFPRSGLPRALPLIEEHTVLSHSTSPLLLAFFLLLSCDSIKLIHNLVSKCFRSDLHHGWIIISSKEEGNATSLCSLHTLQLVGRLLPDELERISGRINTSLHMQQNRFTQEEPCCFL